MKILDEQETLNERDAAHPAAQRLRVSIFLPVYNEEPNLLPLHAKLDEALKTLGARRRSSTSTTVRLTAA